MDGELCADSERARIGEQDALCLSVRQKGASLEAQQGRSDRVGQRPNDRLSVGIFEVECQRGPGSSRENFDGMHFRVLYNTFKFNDQPAVRCGHIGTLDKRPKSTSFGENVKMREQRGALDLYVENAGSDALER